MASKSNNEASLDRYLIKNALPNGQKLGSGSYGSVEELLVNGVICAGKKIHSILVESSNAGVENLTKKYLEECELMTKLRHPHLVQFLGVCYLPDSPNLPVLVMERLHTNLHDLLDSNPGIPLPLKVSILQDVAKGLVYLHSHSPPVVHRDLSAGNVLLNSAMVAKISDLGNSRIVKVSPCRIATLTKMPGTAVYMPPEANQEDDYCRYGCSLDVFSFGVLSLFTLTQAFPQTLLPSTYPDPNNPDNLLARSEIERRKDYIQLLHGQLGETHPLTELVKRCLHNHPLKRPSTEEVLSELEEVKQKNPDQYEHMTKLEMVEKLEVMKRDSRKTDARVDQLESRLLQTSLETTSQLRQKDVRIRQLESQLQQTASKDAPALNFTWRQCADMVYPMEHPSAVVLQGKVFLGGGDAGDMANKNTTVTAYDVGEDRWSKLPITYHAEFFGVTVIHDQLALVAGRDPRSRRASHRIGVWNEKSQKWTEPYSKLPTARYLPTVVAYRKWLVVAGGADESGKALETVEVLDTANNQWYKAPSLPQSCINMTHTVLGDTLYLMGGMRDYKPLKEIFSVSLPSLILDALVSGPCHPRGQATMGTDRSTPWCTLPATPLGYSTAFATQGYLLAIGGKPDANKTEAAVYLYHPDTKVWVHVGDFVSERYWCACITLPNTDTFLVLGGRDTRKSKSRQAQVHMGTITVI